MCLYDNCYILFIIDVGHCYADPFGLYANIFNNFDGNTLICRRKNDSSTALSPLICGMRLLFMTSVDNTSIYGSSLEQKIISRKINEDKNKFRFK